MALSTFRCRPLARASSDAEGFAVQSRLGFRTLLVGSHVDIQAGLRVTGATGQAERLIGEGEARRVAVEGVVADLLGVTVLGAAAMLTIMWAFRKRSPSHTSRNFGRAQTFSAEMMAFGHGMQDAAKTKGIRRRINRRIRSVCRLRRNGSTYLHHSRHLVSDHGC